MPQFHIPHPAQAVAVERLSHSAEQVRGAASSVTVRAVHAFPQPADAWKQTSSAQEFTIVMRRTAVQHAL